MKSKMHKINSIERNRKLISHNRISPIRNIEYTLIVRHNGVQEWRPEIANERVKSESFLPEPNRIIVCLDEQTMNCRQGNTSTASALQWDIASWLGDVLRQWREREIEIRFVSLDYASIKGNLFNSLDIFRSVEHNWRVILASDGKEFVNISVIDELLKAPIDCIEIYPYNVESMEINFRILEAVKNLIDLRSKRGQNLPSVICKCRFKASDAYDDERANKIEAIRQKLKQAGIDEFIMLDESHSKQSEEFGIWDL